MQSKSVSFGPSKAGLITVGNQLFDADGALSRARTTDGVIEIGGGSYFALFPDDHQGVILWDTGEASPRYLSEEINPSSGFTADDRAMLEAIQTKANMIGTGQVTVVAPLSPNGSRLTIVRGDDYNAAEDRQFEWESDAWPDLTDATILFTIGRGGVSLQTEGEVLTASSVRVELTSAQTATLQPTGSSPFDFDVQATLSLVYNERKVTLVHGAVVVIADVTV